MKNHTEMEEPWEPGSRGQRDPSRMRYLLIGSGVDDSAGCAAGCLVYGTLKQAKTPLAP